MSVVADLTKPCLEPIEFQQVQKHFSDSAHTYKQGAQLQHKVGQTLLTKLIDSLPLCFAKEGKGIVKKLLINQITDKTNLFSISQHNLICVDLGCGPGLFTQQLSQRFNKVIALDLAKDMLQANMSAENKVQANSHALPFLPASVDVFYSSLMVQWCDLNQVLHQVHNALKPNGRAVIATLVDGTLFELEQAWSNVNSDKHIHEYLTIEQITSMVATLPWSKVSLDKQTEQFWFSDAKMLAKELKCLGANFVQNRKNKGLMTKSTWQKMEAAYHCTFHNDQKQAIPATYQVMYLELKK